MQCPQCQHVNSVEANFCLNCGSRLAKVCPQCQQVLPPEANFCMACGHKLATVTSPAPPALEPEREPLSYTPQYLAEKILTSCRALERERKQVTVLFADIKDSTELIRDLDPEEAQKLLDPAIHIMMDAVHRFEGTVNQVLGDGIMALFGAPIAHEDHAARACYAALAMQAAMQPYADDMFRSHGITMQIRVGLNSGEVVVCTIGNDLRMDYSAIGDTTNLASRLQQQAEPGEILIHETTARLVQGSIRLEAFAPVEIRGKTEPVSIYKVIGRLPRRSPVVSRGERTLSQFVGRERELATLEELFAQVASGHGQVVGIVAEAGGGKSRLLYEFRQRLQDKRVTYLEGHCLSYGSSIPYPPFIDVLRHKGVLSARIDRLPETHKRLLQTASVIGREFSPRLLGKIWDGSDVLEALLAELKRLEFIFERTGAEETQYVFKHALTQDVAYASLVMARRHLLHAAVGQTLEVLYADHLEDTYDRLAHHYAKTDNAAKAVTYLTLFAEQVAARYAREEALTILQEACQHAERLPDPERHSSALDLAIRQGRLLPEMGRTQEALDHLLAQHAYVEHLQNPLAAAQYYHRLGSVYNSLGAWERALQSAQRCLEEASQCGQEAIRGQAHYLLMMVINFIGQPRRALGHGRQAILLLERTQQWYWLGEVHYWFAFISIRLGNFEQALQSAARTEALGKTIGDRLLQNQGARMAQLTYVTKGEWDQALTWGQRALESTTGPKDASWSSASLGYSYLAQGNVAKAVSLLERVVNHEAYLHAPQQQGWFAAWLGEAYAAQGRIEEAQAVVLRGLHLTRESEYWIGVGIALRALGRVEQASGALAEAEAHLREALQTFAAHGFRPEVARTHLDLAMVAYDQGDQDSATTQLSTAYAWFKKLQMPRYVERTEQLAQEYGVTLTEVELEERMEGLP